MWSPQLVRVLVETGGAGCLEAMIIDVLYDAFRRGHISLLQVQEQEGGGGGTKKI